MSIPCTSLLQQSKRSVRLGVRGFTLIELLVVMAIIVVLAAMILPAVGLLRNRARLAATQETVAGLGIAMANYVAEDPRHFYPSPAVGDLLVHDEADATANLTQLEARGYVVKRSDLDRSGSVPVLVDAWRRPIRYQLDGPFRTSAGVIDGTRMNGTADCPVMPKPADWNPKGVEPWAYLWSLGKPGTDPAADLLPGNVGNWVYVKGSR